VDGICLNETRVYAKYGTIPDWNVSLITNMKLAFADESVFGGTAIGGTADRSEFNANITSWNTASVTDMVG
jgi:surface protein